MDPTEVRGEPGRIVTTSLRCESGALGDMVGKGGEVSLWVDFMRLRDDGRLRSRTRHARRGLQPSVGVHLIVGCEDADPAVAKVMSVDADGGIELQVLPGKVEDHRDVLTSSG